MSVDGSESRKSKVKKSSFSLDESQQISFGAELLRKATHMGALSIPVMYLWVLDSNKSLALSILIPIAMLMTLIDISRLRNWALWDVLKPYSGAMVRKHEEEGDFTGAFYILWMFCLVIAMFEPVIACVSVSFIIVGDTFAALIGRRYGKHKFRGKSLEGSLACLISTLVVAYVGHLLLDLPLSVGVLGAFVATGVEAIPDFVDDNLSVPLISAMAMTLALKLFF